MQISNDYDNYIAKNKYIIVFKIEKYLSEVIYIFLLNKHIYKFC